MAPPQASSREKRQGLCLHNVILASPNSRPNLGVYGFSWCILGPLAGGTVYTKLGRTSKNVWPWCILRSLAGGSSIHQEGFLHSEIALECRDLAGFLAQFFGGGFGEFGKPLPKVVITFTQTPDVESATSLEERLKVAEECGVLP